MKTALEATQGSDAWHAARAQHFCASEAAAAMGVSKYTSRSELLRLKASGLPEDVSPYKQRLFDAGHAAEAGARAIAERLAAAELAPMVYTLQVDGLPLLASLDGIDMFDEVIWENKLLNEGLVGQVQAGDLEPHYWAQLEHQLLVTGAQKALFTTSNGTEEGTHHCWYTSVAERRAAVLAAWKQFQADLAAYVPAEAAAPAPVGRTMEALPALRIEVTGQVTASNLAQYREHALEVFGKINRNLSTDQDFADAEKTVKWCADVEERLAAAKQHALSQTESIDALFRTIDDISAEARRVRLDLDKLVKARKEALRGEIVTEGAQALRAHITALNERLGKPLMPSVPADFAGAIKGKKNLDSMRDAVSAELARAKIEASAVADRIDANLKTIAAAGHDFLFADMATLVLKAPDDLALVVKSRVDAHAAAEAEKAAKAAAAAATAPAPVEAPAPAPAAVVRLAPRAPAATTSAPTLKLGEICTRLCFTVTADFLTGLGYAPAATDRASKLYHEQDFAHICAALVAHIEVLQAKAAA